MLGFTLSKMNLLILVFAVFAILSFFLMNLQNIVVGREANQLVKQYSDVVRQKVRSNNLCDSSLGVYIRPEINFFTSGNSSQRFLYVLNISKKWISDPESQDVLIFSISPRKEREKIIAADSVYSKAVFRLYSYNPNDSPAVKTADVSATDSNTVLDPQATVPVNAMNVVKEVYNGTTYIHVIPCSNVTSSVCENALGLAGCILCHERGGVRKDNASKCIPPLGAGECPDVYSCN